jgi:hypothetical protein
MKDANRWIFRADAVRRYTQSREESVLPRFVSPRTFTYLWILLGLLGVSGFVAWCVRVPVYASGLGVVVDRRGKTNDVRDDVVMVAFLRPENRSRLRVGQTLLVQLDPAGERTRRPIIAIEPKIVSPNAVQRRFALSAGAAHVVTQPSAVAIARFEPNSTNLPASTYVGSVYPVDVEVGSRRVLSLLPLIGQIFGE